jgi:CubicO group peptidase (beta-lactamase class C family)
MKSFFLSALILVATLSLCAQGKKDKLDEIMKTYHTYNMFDGSILVAENGKVIYKNAFGMANREWSIPNGTNTKFMIGSVSKPLTAMLVLLQVQKGLIDLDQTISHYIPEFSQKNGDRITIRQLLSHTSGMPNYDIYKDFFPKISRQFYTREDYIKLYMDAPLAFEPGKNYYYSSWGYFTLGYIMERVTGKSYSQLMKEDIFDKIGMDSSGSYEHTQVVKHRATGYDYSLGEYKSADFRDQSNTMGTGDLYSTVEDLFKFHTAIEKNTLLNKKLTDEMLKSGIAPANYGFGWFNKNFKYQKDSIPANFHLGMTEGFISFIVRAPSKDRLIVFLCNSSPTDFFGIAGSLMRALDNKPVIVKQPVHKAMERLIATKGVVKAVEAFQTLKKDTAHYYVDWISMDFLGNELFNLKRYEEARIFFENNAAEFPDKDLPLLSLAKTYQALGRKQDAIIWYKKMIALGTVNQEAKNRLKELEATN